MDQPTPEFHQARADEWVARRHCPQTTKPNRLPLAIHGSTDKSQHNDPFINHSTFLNKNVLIATPSRFEMERSER